MKSEKVYLNKKIKLIWLVLIVIFLISVLLTIIPYSKYKKGQDLAVASMLIATHEFDEYKDNKKELIQEMYDYWNRHYYNISTKYGTIDYSGVREAVSKAEDSLEEILENEGYTEGYSVDHYFKYTNFLSYYFYKDFPFLVLFAIICVIYLFLNIFYFFSR